MPRNNAPSVSPNDAIVEYGRNLGRLRMCAEAIKYRGQFGGRVMIVLLYNYGFPFVTWDVGNERGRPRARDCRLLLGAGAVSLAKTAADLYNIIDWAEADRLIAEWRTRPGQ